MNRIASSPNPERRTGQIAICEPDSHAALCPVCGQTGARDGCGRLTGCTGDRNSTHWCAALAAHGLAEPSAQALRHASALHGCLSQTDLGRPARTQPNAGDSQSTLAPYKQSGALLDLGCSSGSFLEFMRSKSWKLYGIEMSARDARERPKRGSGAEVFVGDIPERPSTGRLRCDHLLRCAGHSTIRGR